MLKPVELQMYDFLAGAVTAAVGGDPLFGVEVHDTIYQEITKDKVIRVSDAMADPAPGRLGGIQEWNVTLQLALLNRLISPDQKQRAAALQGVFELEFAVLELIYGDPSLGSAENVCDLEIGKLSRGYDEWDGKVYAVVNIPFVVNPFK